MKEKRGMGTALRRMIGAAPPPAGKPRGSRESVLMNSTRLRIFQSLCNCPCSHVRALSRNVGVAPASVLWHLGKLLERGVVRRERAGNRTIFYPADLLQEEDIALLSFLCQDRRAPTLRLVLERPGITQGELVRGAGCNSHTPGLMVGRGILEVVKDGRLRRYYPAPLFRQRKEHHDHRARKFKQLLLSRLAEDGLSPESAGWDRDYLEVRLRLGTSVESLRFLCNPYALEARR